MKPKPRALAPWVRERRNRWLLLGLVATGALAAVVLFGLTGWLSGGSDTRRDAVAAYIEEVNATQRAFAIERQRASRVYERARTNPRGLAVNLADLDRSAKELRRFDVRMRALEPPPDARSLDRKLVALTAAEAGFAADVARLGRFLRLLSIERSRVALASRALRSELAAAGNTGEQAAAFDRFWTYPGAAAARGSHRFGALARGKPPGRLCGQDGCSSASFRDRGGRRRKRRRAPCDHRF
jgi:hypothetical protein